MISCPRAISTANTIPNTLMYFSRGQRKKMNHGCDGNFRAVKTSVFACVEIRNNDAENHLSRA